MGIMRSQNARSKHRIHSAKPALIPDSGKKILGNMEDSVHTPKRKIVSRRCRAKQKSIMVIKNTGRVNVSISSASSARKSKNSTHKYAPFGKTHYVPFLKVYDESVKKCKLSKIFKKAQKTRKVIREHKDKASILGAMDCRRRSVVDG
jgi:hypothetical protein